MKYYIVPEEDLLNLLKFEVMLNYLNFDNKIDWDNQQSGIIEFLSGELGVEEEQIILKGYDFENVARENLQKYKSI